MVARCGALKSSSELGIEFSAWDATGVGGLGVSEG